LTDDREYARPSNSGPEVSEQDAGVRAIKIGKKSQRLFQMLPLMS
jgi:hypothetical protein